MKAANVASVTLPSVGDEVLDDVLAAAPATPRRDGATRAACSIATC